MSSMYQSGANGGKSEWNKWKLKFISADAYVHQDDRDTTHAGILANLSSPLNFAYFKEKVSGLIGWKFSVGSWQANALSPLDSLVEPKMLIDDALLCLNWLQTQDMAIWTYLKWEVEIQITQSAIWGKEGETIRLQ